jgi:RNA polymerase sigma factor (sigma-70 family)
VNGEPLTDAELVARCRAGDDQAWAMLVERFSRFVHAIAVAGFRLPPHEAEDVFQEVFARAYEHLDSLREDGAVRPWLAQLTRRLCIDAIRARMREQPTDELMETAVFDDRLARIDEAMTIHQALAGLSDSCQEILDRFFAKDESYRTISEQLELPAGTIASRISRCLTKLRSELEGRKPVATQSGTP